MESTYSSFNGVGDFAGKEVVDVINFSSGWATANGAILNGSQSYSMGFHCHFDEYSLLLSKFRCAIF